MNIDINDTITLDDNNEYVVTSKINYHNTIYYILIDKYNNTIIKFLYENQERHTLVELEDEELIKTLLPLFLKETENYITE